MPRLLFAALVAVFSLIWSSAFIAGAVALKDFDPFSLLAIRFSTSALLIFPFCLTGHALFNASVMRQGLLLGLLNNAIYLGLSFTALRMIRPEVVIVVISCAPFVTSLIAARIGLEAVSARLLGGIGLGFLGVVIISGILSTQKPSILGLLLATAGMIAFASGTVLFRSRSGQLPILQTNFWQSVAGAAALLPLAFAFGQPIHAPSPQAIAALLYLVLVVTIGGMALWLALIRASGAATASSYHLLNPIFGLLLAHSILGKPLHATDFVGAAFIATGLVLTMKKGVQSHVQHR